MANKLAREKREFIIWLATPDADRTINTQYALAEKLGVDKATLSQWRHDPKVIAEVNRMVDEHFGDEYRDIAESFKQQARLGSYQHQKTYFEMLGKYTPPTQTNKLIGDRDKPVGIEVTGIDYRSAIAPLAPGPMDDSDPSGED